MVIVQYTQKTIFLICFLVFFSNFKIDDVMWIAILKFLQQHIVAEVKLLIQNYLGYPLTTQTCVLYD